MISNERRWPSYGRQGRQPSYQHGYQHGYQQQPYPHPAPRPSAPEDTLKTLEVEIERKRFTLLLKENARGRFLRVIETSGGKSNSIILPASGLADFNKVLAEFVKEAPAAEPPGAAAAEGNAA